MARYSGRLRPAWRINQTGVVSTASRRQARKNRLSCTSPSITPCYYTRRYPPLPEQGQGVGQGPMDRGIDRRIPLGVAPGFRVTQGDHERLELGEIGHLVDHDKFLVVEARGVEQDLAHAGEFVADADMLVHHALAGFLAHQIPGDRLHERVDDQV